MVEDYNYDVDADSANPNDIDSYLHYDGHIVGPNDADDINSR